MDIIEIIKSKNGLTVGKPTNKEIIEKAEKELNVKFTKEYKDYLSSFGFAVFDNHELTGICKAKRLNVIEVTKLERQFNQTISNDWYVIEQANIDGIVIWQSPSGEIFQTVPNSTPIKIFSSLTEYIAK